MKIAQFIKEDYSLYVEGKGGMKDLTNQLKKKVDELIRHKEIDSKGVKKLMKPINELRKVLDDDRNFRHQEGNRPYDHYR